MRNCTLTIVGQKGSGKTTFARQLAALSPRVIVIDRFFEYPGAVATDFAAAVDYLAANWRSRFKLVCRFSNDLYHREMFRYLIVTARRCPTLPIALVLEEADFFADPAGIEPTVAYLYKYGRHWRLNLIAVARGDTDLHRLIVNNTDCLVAFRQRKFSANMRAMFHSEDLQRIMRLETYSPLVRGLPEKGRHFLTYPDDADPVALWKTAQAEPAAPVPEHVQHKESASARAPSDALRGPARTLPGAGGTNLDKPESPSLDSE